MITLPAVIAEVTDIPSASGGICIAGPQAWNTTADQLSIESTSNHNGNRVAEKGEIHGAFQPKWQDTYITGTTTPITGGKAFVVNQGTVKDDWIAPRSNRYGLLFPKASDTIDVEAEVIDPRIYSAQVVVRRGPNPGSNTTPNYNNFFSYVHFAYRNSVDIRVSMVWGQPLTLDLYDGAWNVGIDVSKMVVDMEAYFAANSGVITLNCIADYLDDTFVVKIGSYVALKARIPGGLPAFGNVRYFGQNGDGHFEYYPLRFQPLTVKKSPRDFGEIRSGGFLSVNGRGATSVDQVDTKVLTGNGQAVGYEVSSYMPDAGDGLGAVDPPKGIDYTLVIPAVWVDPLFTDRTIFFPPVMYADLLETLNDATHTYSSSAILPVNNWNHRYDGSYGQVSVDLSISANNDPYLPAFTGIGGWGPEGIKTYERDGTRIMTLPCSDNSVKMQIPLNEEVCFDGWYVGNVVQFLMECGNVRKEFLNTNLPPYIPPDGDAESPYGMAGSDCPGFILPSGSGLQGKWTFQPDWTPWDVLQRIVVDLGEEDPITGQNVPYYMGWTPGQVFNFITYNPRGLFSAPAISYSEWDSSGYGAIEEIEVFNSVYQMRSSIDFQGLDADTHELLYYHLPMPANVLSALGYRWPWLERDVRFTSRAYMERIANNAAVQASIPTTVWRQKVPYHPWVRAGMNALSTARSLGGTREGYITEIQSKVGVDEAGKHHGYSYITMRSIDNF